MLCSTNGTTINAMQLKRIQEHPFQVIQTLENTMEKFAVNDNLETGSLKIFLQFGNALTVQQLFSFNTPEDAVLVAELTIGALWQNEGVFIHSISCEYGYEYLVKPMLEQAVKFATFYECYQSVRISAKEREKWFIFAGGILADFHQKGRTYIYQIR